MARSPQSLFTSLLISILASAIGVCLLANPANAVQEKETFSSSKQSLRTVILSSYKSTHDGWSSDEVVLNAELNKDFITECQKTLPSVSPAKLNWTLLNMRKAGLLKVPTTKRSRAAVESATPIAEIAARSIQDRMKVSTDRMMCDPELRSEFDTIVQSIDMEMDLYLARKAAFRLRKQRKLKPELIARIADWGREIKTFPLEEVKQKPKAIPEHPGIYIFRDQSGYLYIGQSEDLQKRLQEHLEESSNFSLANYLANQSNHGISIEIHAFAPDSRASETMIRRAYESELIASRKPRFNIQP